MCTGLNSGQKGLLTNVLVMEHIRWSHTDHSMSTPTLIWSMAVSSECLASSQNHDTESCMRKKCSTYYNLEPAENQLEGGPAICLVVTIPTLYVAQLF
jgi:hypothetical protein